MKFKSTVIRGRRHGSSIGYPTANLAVNQAMREFFNREGVWAVKVTIGNNQYTGALFFGKRSLFEDKEPVCEVLLVDYYEADLYTETVEVEIINFIRLAAQVKSNEELKKIIENDLKIIRDN